MEIGIEEKQLNILLGGFSASANPQAVIAGFNRPDYVRRVAQQGFRLIELASDMSLFFPNTTSGEAIEGLANLKQELGLRYTVHLPLWSIELSTPQESVRRGSIEATVDAIRSTLPLEPEIYVLHATGALAAEFFRMRLPEIARHLVLRQFQANAMKSLEAILKETGLNSRRLAIETIEFPFSLTIEMAEAFNLSICLDTGHVLSGFSGDVQLFDVLERVLPRLGEIHLHDSPYQTQDNIFYGRDHQALGTGDLDIPRLFQKLEEANFQGPIVFELEIEKALQSLQVIQQKIG